MSDIGYTNAAQKDLRVSYNNLNLYLCDLKQALRTPVKRFEEIGTKGPDGQWRQLNTNLLQIENEFYNPVRPKQMLGAGERTLVALEQRGVAYIEVRALDINPFLNVGIDEEEMRFLEVFLIFCILEDSPQFDNGEREHTKNNLLLTAIKGRDPNLLLHDVVRNEPRLLREWVQDIFEQLLPIAQARDNDSSFEPNETEADGPFTRATKAQLHKVNTNQFPSARVLDVMRENKEGFLEFGMKMSLKKEEIFKAHPLSEEERKHYQSLATESLREQQELEESDKISFEEYLQQYFASVNYDRTCNYPCASRDFSNHF